LNSNRLKTKKQDRNFREMFRHKLENAEIIPDPSVSSKLMRKLALKEFMHFDPVRFNVYYLGGILVAGLAIGLALTSGPVRENHITPEIITNELPVGENAKNPIIPVRPAPEVRSGAGNSKSTAPVTVVTSSAPEKASVSPTIVQPEHDSGEYAKIAQGVMSESFKKKGFFNKSDEDNLKLRDNLKKGESLFEASVTKGCAPLKVLFHNKVSDSDSCQWIFGDGGSSVSRDAEWIYDVDGEYKVVLKVFRPGGQTETSSSLISVYPKPSARFEISPEKAILPDDEIHFQNYSAAAVRYFWSFGDGSTSEQFDPLHRYEKYGNYNVGLKVFSEYGCADSLVIYNAFSVSAYFIRFPNAFIPSIDGPSGGVYSFKIDESAQVFHPSYSGVTDYNLKIFSKLGILVFETNDVNIGWDGYFKGQLSNPGVYIWKVRGNFRNGEPFTRMGDVTLLKN
jgi:PKD repeat protein